MNKVSKELVDRSMSDQAAVERYIAKILENIHAPADEKKRIEADLRGHFTAAQEAGEPVIQVMERLGAPVEVAQAYMMQLPLEHVGFWPRLAAFAIDLVVILPIVGLLSICAIGLANLVPDSPKGLGYLAGALLIMMCIGCALAAVGMILLYFPILEGRFGQTVGKKLLGCRVLKENGLPAGYKETFIRRISFYFNLLPVDALFIPFNARKQRAFDIVARTIVVRDK